MSEHPDHGGAWLAPVIDLAGARYRRGPEGPRAGAGAPARGGVAFAADGDEEDEGRGADSGFDAVEPDVDVEAVRRTLMRRLGGRQLSVAEASALLRDAGLDDAAAAEIVAEFEGSGYLDDAGLAEQLVHTATARKAQGRQAIARTLAQRGIAREDADEALREIDADDEAERALEFARAKARVLEGVEHDRALRRLTGQLARRGFHGALAMSVARRALDELGGGRGGVRFR